MRKRKLPLEKKLSLNKEAVALLNASQQTQIAGGAAAASVLIGCMVTNQATCVTIPPGQMYCIMC
ncbi:class I lanthipeptide [Chitinophaga sp. sic0106]|uniref:class I lanthipeptide n=1 Tax=Chitinophaga sp. sic0106 TaxID=2854785 RepID=UPI001C454FE0|nr:class I lanthipeptide [Chitinophaga sp. sic0106]MBV7530262.1 class I lanthipeptide [Chitinophaga sp. sic0106]